MIHNLSLAQTASSKLKFNIVMILIECWMPYCRSMLHWHCQFGKPDVLYQLVEFGLDFLVKKDIAECRAIWPVRSCRVLGKYNQKQWLKEWIFHEKFYSGNYINYFWDYAGRLAVEMRLHMVRLTISGLQFIYNLNIYIYICGWLPINA